MYSQEEVKKLIKKAFNNEVIDGKKYIQNRMSFLLSSTNYIIQYDDEIGEIISWEDEELKGIVLYVKGNYMNVL